ncbi:MAG: phosphatidylserine decarboxylase [Chromatiales bacterium]|nr:MAG: phosphatidylserine decarboxylase [Chromatiales bacterium]
MTELYVALQRLLPQFLLGRVVHRLARVRTPWFKDLCIRGFTRLFPVNLAEAAHPVPSGYATFNAFFTRALQPGARPQDPDPDAITCPADGRVQQAGTLDDGRLLQAKGMTYTAAELLGDADSAAPFRDGWFLTVYLAPQDYHRVHAPRAGTLTDMLYVPGARLSVNESTAAAVPGLFARNERLVCQFASPDGPFAMVLVGALNVASISTTWAGEVLPCEPRRLRRWHYAGHAGITVGRGDEIGCFNLGSTVILLLPPGFAPADGGLAPGQPLRVGQRVAVRQ